MSLKNLRSLTIGVINLLFLLIITTSNAFSQGTVVDVTYESSTQGTTCHLNIYLPPGYNEQADSVNNYPVYYLIHGGGENYQHWVNSGYADKKLDKFIAEGKAVPMILVMPDGKNLDPPVFSDELLNDIIPFVESNYRVKTDKDSRAVGGLSWGGIQALEPGLYHYEMFGYMTILSSGWFSTDTQVYDKVRTFLDTNAVAFEENMRYFYFGIGTTEDIAYENGQLTVDVFRDYDITLHYWEFPSGHWWGVWRQDFEACVPYLFRDTSTVYISLEFMGGNIKNSTVMCKKDSTLTAPGNPTKSGHTFEGWFKDKDYTTAFDFATETINKNTTIYAKWSINSYQVSFDADGGDPTPNAQTVVYNTLAEEPSAPVKEGLIFDGWYTNKNYRKKWDFTTDLVTKEMTLYAKWSSISSAEENIESEIFIFPNPGNSSIKIANLNKNSCLKIYDMRGLLVRNNENLTANSEINIEDLASGIYILEVSWEDFNYQTKLIKE